MPSPVDGTGSSQQRHLKGIRAGTTSKALERCLVWYDSLVSLCDPALVFPRIQQRIMASIGSRSGLNGSHFGCLDGPALARILALACKVQSRRGNLDDLASLAETLHVAIPVLLAAHPTGLPVVPILGAGLRDLFRSPTLDSALILESGLYDIWLSLVSHTVPPPEMDPELRVTDLHPEPECGAWQPIWSLAEAGVAITNAALWTTQSSDKGWEWPQLLSGQMGEGEAPDLAHVLILSRLCLNLLWHESPGGWAAGQDLLAWILVQTAERPHFCWSWLKCMQCRLLQRRGDAGNLFCGPAFVSLGPFASNM